MNRQEVFDKVVERAKQMTKPAVNSNGDCCYRSDNGPCFIGALIKDEAYSLDIEGTYVRDAQVISALNQSGLNVEIVNDEDFLYELQQVHDSMVLRDTKDSKLRGAAFRSKILSKLKTFAVENNVVYNG